MRHERWGQGLHLPYDFYMTTPGKQLFIEQTSLLSMNMVILGQLTITSALLRSKDKYKRWRLFSNSESAGSSMGTMDIDMRFGILNKKPKTWYTLSNWARRMASKLGVSFDKAIHAQTIKEQIIYGSDFETEAYRRGPQGPINLEQGSFAINTTPDNIELVEEPSYLLHNVGQGDDATQMLVSGVQVGRVGYLNILDPMMKDTWDYHFLNFDRGNCEIEVQTWEDILNAALCWDDDGELDRHCYHYLTQGDRATSFAREKLGIPT
jgi:hypothetical protein